MMEIKGKIQKRKDGSYTIDYNGLPYHAHQEATPEAWQAAEDYAKANPDMVEPWVEVVPKLSPEQLRTMQFASLDAIIPRSVEDLYTELKITPKGKTAEAIAEKIKLRAKK